MKSKASNSKKIMLILGLGCILWVVVFLILSSIQRSQQPKWIDNDLVFDTSLLPTGVQDSIDPINVQGALDNIATMSKLVNESIDGAATDFSGKISTAQMDKRLNISFDEDRLTYYVILDVQLTELNNISYEIDGVTVVIERVFRNSLTNQPESVNHYTYELPGPVKEADSKLIYEKGHVVIVLPKS